MAEEKVQLNEYINKKTGFSIQTESVMKGAWVLKSDYKPEEDEAEKPSDNDGAEKPEGSETPENEETTGDEAYNAVTKAQIMQELDDLKVEYDKKASKKDLYDLMMAQGV